MLAGSLCRRHADALIVPKGWHIDDRREEIPRLFPARALSGRDDSPSPSTATESTPSSGIRKRSPRSHESAPSLFDADNTADTASGRDDERVAPVRAGDGDLEETRAIPWMPRIVSRGAETDNSDDSNGESDEDDAPSDATPAQGRLLRRAFGDRNVR
jgi:hypothetical protein